MRLFMANDNVVLCPLCNMGSIMGSIMGSVCLNKVLFVCLFEQHVKPPPLTPVWCHKRVGRACFHTATSLIISAADVQKYTINAWTDLRKCLQMRPSRCLKSIDVCIWSFFFLSGVIFFTFFSIFGDVSNICCYFLCPLGRLFVSSWLFLHLLLIILCLITDLWHLYSTYFNLLPPSWFQCWFGVSASFWIKFFTFQQPKRRDDVDLR